jgi:tetratricopeptide (TPR) repeat protein
VDAALDTLGAADPSAEDAPERRDRERLTERNAPSNDGILLNSYRRAFAVGSAGRRWFLIHGGACASIADVSAPGASAGTGDDRSFISMLLEEAAPELKGPRPDAWFDRLEREDDRLDAALEWCLEHDPERGRALGGALWPFWMNRGRIPEGRQWLDRLLAAPTVELRTLARAHALYGAGTLAFVQGDGDTALPLHQESLAIAEELGDPEASADALIGLARVALLAGDTREMRRRSEQSLAVARESGLERSTAQALHHLVEAMRREGDLEAAIPLYHESLELQRQLGSERGVALELHNLGNVERKRGNLDAAAELLTESLSIYGRLRAARNLAYCFLGLGNLAAAEGDAERAALLISLAEKLFEEAGVALDPDYREDYERSKLWARSALGENYDLLTQNARTMSLEEGLAYAGRPAS